MKYFSYQHSFTSLLGPYGHAITEEMASAHLIEHGKVLVHFIIYKYESPQHRNE